MKKSEQDKVAMMRELVRRREWLGGEIARLNRQIASTFMAPSAGRRARQGVRLFDITIDPGSYSGTYQIYVQNGGQISNCAGPCTLRLLAGDYVALVASGNIPFSVLGTGALKVAGGLPATVAKKTHLVFDNARITVDPGLYDGAYYLAGHYGVPLRGEQEIVIVPGMNNFVSVYGNGVGTEILFTTDANGKINPRSVMPPGAALPTGKTLTFQTAQVTVIPGLFLGGYIPAGHYCEPFPLKKSFAFVKNLACFIEFYGCGMGQEVFFQVDNNGQVPPGSISNPLALTAAGALLTINPRSVSITTDFTGPFRIGNTYFPQRKRDRKKRLSYTFVMVMNYKTFIQIVDGDSADITPGVNGVNPPTVTILDAANQPQVFTFS